MGKLFMIFCLFGLSSCSGSMPQRIHPELLSHPTAEEAELLEQIERQIIQIPDEKDQLQQRQLATKAQLSQETTILSQIRQQITQLEAQISAAQKAEDKTKAAQIKGILSARQLQEQKETARIRYFEDKSATEQAELALLNAHLAVGVAKQMRLQAQIAHRYLNTDEGKALKGFDPIDPQVYQTYLDQVIQARILVAEKTSNQKAKFAAKVEPPVVQLSSDTETTSKDTLAVPQPSTMTQQAPEAP